MFFQKIKFLSSKIISLLLIIILIVSCDKPNDNVIDYQLSNYFIEKINAPEIFSYSSSDSVMAFSLTLKNQDAVENIYVNLKLADASKYFYENITLYKKQNLSSFEYSGSVKMSKVFSSGKYALEFFVIDKINYVTRKVAEHLFIYDNKQINYPPVISDLKIPNSVSRGVSFTFSIKVDDSNGLNDISLVFFKLYRPDGSIVIPNASTPNIDYFIMVDNGDMNLGDEKANDGVYSFRNSFGQSSSVGNWTFEFQAIDKSNAKSNIIKNFVEVN